MGIKWGAFALLLLVGVVFAPAHASQPVCADGSSVHIAQGQVCAAASTRQPDILVYKGLPFAKPPIPANNLRWVAPQPPEAWTTERAATAFGPICPQYDDSSGVVHGAEDCLYLNVWTPKAALAQPRSLPVMVFLYGGSFTSGAGSLASYDGAVLAATGPAVVVTLNYRLGALGFLYADKAPSGARLEPPIPGNLGVMDQQAALRWVEANIAAFGGDPTKVTLFGESAGAMSAGLHHFTIPSSTPLFRATIMESNPMGIRYDGPAQASDNGALFLRLLCGRRVKSANCHPSFAELQAFSLAQVFKAQDAYGLDKILSTPSAGFPQSIQWAPVIDGDLITGQPQDGYGAANIKTPKPYIFGVNADEGTAFAGMTCASFASNHGQINPVPSEAAQCIPAGATSSEMNEQWYDEAMTSLYGAKPAAAITAFRDAGDHRPYDAHTLPGTSYYNAPSQAMAAVSNDDSFVCAGLRAADRSLAQVPGQQVHAYVFAQPPLFDLYKDTGTTACIPANGQVCHADELAFVFNTLTVTATEFNGTLPVPATDRRLAGSMAVAWTRFARDLAPPAPWQPYAATGGFWRWQGTDGAMVPTMNLADKAHCPTLWNKITP